MGLSQITPDPAAQQGLLLNVYIDILDEFDSRIKAPGMFRFELYEYVPEDTYEAIAEILRWIASLEETEPEIVL